MDSEFQAGPLRGLRHQGWQAVVSVVGLAVSIVCLTFSVNWLWTETHYDSFRPGYKDLYVVEREDSLEHTESLLYRWGDRVSRRVLLQARHRSGVVCLLEGLLRELAAEPGHQEGAPASA